MNKTWEVLGLTHGATLEQITYAYRKLAMKLHPDRGGVEADFKRLKAAYEWLLENHEIAEPVIVKSSLDDRTSESPTVNRSATAGFNGYNQWEEREVVELDENIRNGQVGSGFAGYNTDGTTSYRFELGQLLRGDKVKLKLPNFRVHELQLPKRVQPGSVIPAELEGSASWLKGKRQVKIKVGLNPHPIYSVTGLNLTAVVQLPVLQAIERKPITLEHPYLISSLTGAPQQLQLPIPDIIGISPIVFKNYGFDDGSSIGDLLIYTMVELPKNLTEADLKTIRKIF